jgi:hypothetical protein
VPIFDGGRRRANVDAAKARYELAAVQLPASARQAVREVEEALVNLDSTAARSDDASTALEGYRSAFVAAEDRYKNGLASLLELEDARRTRLAAENAVVTCSANAAPPGSPCTAPPAAAGPPPMPTNKTTHTGRQMKKLNFKPIRLRRPRHPGRDRRHHGDLLDRIASPPTTRKAARPSRR